MNILNQLSPKTYNYDIPNHPSLHLASGLQYGLIAQDVESILLGIVRSATNPATLDSNGIVIIPEETFKGINYSALIPILISVIKDQQHQIDSLIMNDSLINLRFNELSRIITDCCAASHARLSNDDVQTNSIDVKLSSENTIILNQNDPNPFAEQTRISYVVPEEVTEAKIIFFDNSGRVLQTVIINERGAGVINVYGEKLSSGVYSYSLIADNKVIDIKKMICSK